MRAGTEAERARGLDDQLMGTISAAVERAPSRAVLVLPLVEGAQGRAAELLRQGPPFDPDEVGLGRHQVFLTESEAVFLFESDSPGAAERLLSSSCLWAAAVPGRISSRARLDLLTTRTRGFASTTTVVLQGHPRPGRQRRRRRLLSV